MRKPELLYPPSVQRDIALLGIDGRAYYRKKLVSCGWILAAAVFFAIGYGGWLIWRGQQSIEGVPRPESYGEAEDIMLKTGQYGTTYSLTVEPVLLSEQEAEEALETLVDRLDTWILLQNTDRDSIESDLYLPDSIEGYPFQIYWESSREDLIDTYGTVDRSGLSEDTAVLLTGIFQYGDRMWEVQFGVVLKRESLTEEEAYIREMEALLTDSEESSRTERVWRLPDSMGEEKLEYRIAEEDQRGWLLVGLGIFLAAGIWFGRDYDLRKKRLQRRESFQSLYGDLIVQLALYVSAGMPLQRAVLTAVRNVADTICREPSVRSVFDRFTKAYDSGMGFYEALEQFAEACDMPEYRTLASWIEQGERNGVQDFAKRLEQELKAIEKQKRRACSVKSEKISTALMMPMMLELGVVAALIMIPAFLGMHV